ncbi:MAG: metal-dependent hydrolase [Planctomycetes bacterium]|nr:metal-dependent hydrolase [Planctomycetota bacterium]
MNSGQITFIGHASFRLTLPDERVILIDPWLANNPACPDSEKAQPRCDYIALTHGHSDHTEDVPALVKQHSPKVVTNIDFASVLESACPGGQYCGMNLGGTQVIDDIKFTMTRAFHSSGYATKDGMVYAGMPGGFVIEAPGLATVYHAGDTDVFSDMKLIDELYAPKIIMLPIGDHFTMGPKGAAIAAKYFDPAVIIPMHYGTFPALTGTLDAFNQHLSSDLTDRVVTMNPGDTVGWTNAGTSG